MHGHWVPEAAHACTCGNNPEGQSLEGYQRGAHAHACVHNFGFPAFALPDARVRQRAFFALSNEGTLPPGLIHHARGHEYWGGSRGRAYPRGSDSPEGVKAKARGLRLGSPSGDVPPFWVGLPGLGEGKLARALNPLLGEFRPLTA
jgi:hypothetical protein